MPEKTPAGASGALKAAPGTYLAAVHSPRTGGWRCGGLQGANRYQSACLRAMLTLAQIAGALEAAWTHAPPGRECAAQNELLRGLSAACFHVRFHPIVATLETSEKV